VIKNKILIIGSGGREHALGWKLKQSPKVEKIYFAPGTAGTELVGENTNINALDFDSLIKFAIENSIDLTIAGPDDILAAGIVNVFTEKGLKIFGATKEAAQIESSKAFAKELMKKQNIPTASYQTFTDSTAAKKYLKDHPLPVVIKASGLALGKGVIIATDLEDAMKAIDDMMVQKVFGDAGVEVVIEEFMVGKEISIHAFSDGNTFKLFPTSRDHKPIFDGNKGPNTGGMGTIAPVPGITKEELDIIKVEIVSPALSGLKISGIPFTGCLYPGLMMTSTGPKVVEFNSRFGDPEMESYMRLLKTDLFDIILACVDGTLSDIDIEWHEKSACCIVLASDGYPAGSHKGDEIFGLEKFAENEDIVIFHFATKEINGKIVTNGGRVLGVTATGHNLDEALQKAYSAIGQNGIHFNGMQYRKDIGKIL
jgi:phosphoribosylamine---glycine ligase